MGCQYAIERDTPENKTYNRQPFAGLIHNTQQYKYKKWKE
jgi:hypothetical protein